ncbi:MAG: RnfABCDGE type electron transport complex subunit D [Clostridia bacterium]|nr:RnfABCDGE type electron transport complex subunit D [Clostridia bacterium]
MKWHRVARSADGQDAARGWDWVTALSPLLLMMVVNYRWSAVWAVLTAAAGYAAVTVLWQWLKLTPCRVAPALLCGVLVACCLPSAVPVWLAALAGLVGGVLAVVPVLLNRLFRREVLSCPVYFPALAGYLTVRFALPAYFAAFAQPMMWISADTAAGATPLAALGDPAAAAELSHLFWGFDAGSMGGGPAPAVLLGGVYLLLRRRLHLIPVGGMLGVVALLSWLFWDMPVYGLLGGGTLLAAVLLGDEALVHVGWKGRLTAGVTAGAVTVLCRVLWRMDGSAVGVLAAGLLTPLLHVVYHWLCPYVRLLWEKIRKSKK